MNYCVKQHISLHYLSVHYIYGGRSYCIAFKAAVINWGVFFCVFSSPCTTVTCSLYSLRGFCVCEELMRSIHTTQERRWCIIEQVSIELDPHILPMDSFVDGKSVRSRLHRVNLIEVWGFLQQQGPVTSSFSNVFIYLFLFIYFFLHFIFFFSHFIYFEWVTQ